MKKQLLIVTEDIAKIQTLSGKLGNLCSFLYQFILGLKLKIIILIFRDKYDITVLATDKHLSKLVNNLSYSEQLDLSKTAKYKSLAWQLTTKISNTINKADKRFSVVNSIPLISLWENKISVQLIYHYFSYFELLTRLITSQKYSHVLVLGNSTQEQIAKFISERNDIKLINYSNIKFNTFINNLFLFFRHRELKKKIKAFVSQSQKTKPLLSTLTQPILLSIDLFRHLKTLVPIYQELQKLKANPLFVAEESSIQSHLENFKLKKATYVFLASFLPTSYITSQISKWQTTTAKIHSQVKKDLVKKPQNIEQLFLNLFFYELSPIIKRGLILSRLYLEAGEKLFLDLKPKHIVVAADVRLTELTLSFLAKKYHIPSITVSPRTIIFKEETYKYNLTDYISVTGQYAKDQLVKLRVPSNKIIINGDPRYDYFTFLEKNFSTRNAFQKLGITPTNKKVILLISDRPSSCLPKDEKKDIFLQVSQAVKNHQNTLLVIKPHPTEKKYLLQDELKQWGITNAIVSNNHNIELFDLLKISSTVIIAWSMTGLEAMMLKKPVIIVNPHKKDYDKHIPYLKNKSVVQSHTISTLTKYLEIYTNHKHPKTKKLITQGLIFSGRYIQKNDGKVAQRICKHIVKAS